MDHPHRAKQTYSCFPNWDHRLIAFSAAMLITMACPDIVLAIDPAQAKMIGREYLTSENEAERTRLVETLADYHGEIQPVIEELSRHSFEAVKAGIHPGEHFTSGKLQKKHPDDLLYFNVPKSYQTDRAAGLIIFMHGGGKTTPREHPRLFMDDSDTGEIDKDGDPRQIGDVFAATGMIAVGPSAPWDESSNARWCVRDADEYLADVIAECKNRFNIDADRVFLIGHSMGGYGAFHHAQRQPDRFAAVVAAAGSWNLAYLPAIRGTKLCVIQAVNDAQLKVRWHFTDIEYGRQTEKLLSGNGLDHTYLEHDGGHPISFSREDVAKFFRSAESLRRDPYYSHVALASPVGFHANYCFPVKHNRWLTLDESTDGTIEYDRLLTNGSKDFDEWKLRHETSRLEGSAIDAENHGDNTIVVKTQNVKRFTVWLHPKMVDIAKPVTVMVNGKTRFEGKVKPSLVTALESYERRADWGLIYPVKIEVDERR